MRTCQFRPKQNVGWASPKKPSRPTLQIFYATPKQENFHCCKNKIHYRPASVLKKKICAMSAEKYQSGLFHDRCRLLFFLFNPRMKFEWWRLGNVRSALSGETSFLDLDRLSFLADVDCHFFYQYRWIIFFCRGGLTSWPNKGEHARFGRNKTSIELARKNLADLHCKFFKHHQNKKTSSVVKTKYIIGQWVF